MGKSANYSSSVSELEKQYKDASNLSARQRIYRFAKSGNAPWPRWVFDHLEFPERAHVLELGCGNAALWKSNVDRIPAGWEITLTDFSPGMLDEARAALEGAARRFTFQRMDAQSIAFGDGSFDGVIANHMLYHVPRPERDRVIAEVRRVLRDGGTFFAATNGQNHLREIKDLIDACVAPPPSDPDTAMWLGVGSFFLEGGEEQLRRHFSDVRVLRFCGELMVTDAQAIVDYALSIEWVKPVLVGDELVRFRAVVEKRIAKDGAICINTEAGLLRAVRL
jgi:SAM-dependent methyltransferase